MEDNNSQEEPITNEESNKSIVKKSRAPRRRKPQDSETKNSEKTIKEKNNTIKKAKIVQKSVKNKEAAIEAKESIKEIKEDKCSEVVSRETSKPRRRESSKNQILSKKEKELSEDSHCCNQQNEIEEKTITPVKKELLSFPALRKLHISKLQEMAASKNISLNTNAQSLKSSLIYHIVKKASSDANHHIDIYFEGVIEILHNGPSFARSQHNNYKESAEDIYISQYIIKSYGLREGDTISGFARAPRSKERYFSAISITSLNFKPYKKGENRLLFEAEIPEYPKTRIHFETTKENGPGRILDLVTPIGRGQRALISAPPRCGKTVLMKSMALSIAKNYPDIYTIALLIDERPEEVTDMLRSLPNTEVVASTFDEEPDVQIHLAEIVYHKAKRLCEAGFHVVIFLDSITRLARGYNAVQTGNGRSLSGGIDQNALHKAKKFFGLARNLQDAGSISIIGSCLIQTNSKMDEVIHEEFKGRGNCDIYLSSALANRRIFPAIDIEKSGTRQEETLLHADENNRHIQLRRDLANYTSVEQLSMLLSRIKNTQNNIELLMSI